MPVVYVEVWWINKFIKVLLSWQLDIPTVSVGIFKLSGPLGIDNAATVAKFKVYPNPTTSNVTIAANLDVDSFNLSVTDLTGKILMTKSLNGIENTVDISNLSSGAYFFELSSNTKKEVVKILKN